MIKQLYYIRRHGASASARDLRHGLRAVLLLALLAVAPGNLAMAAEKVMILTYHVHAPFIVERERGLTYDLAAFLNERTGGRYSFEVRPMSRPALNKAIDEPSAAVVPWVNPAWFKDQEEIKYAWLGSVLMRDGNAIVSRSDRPIVYEGPESLSGMTMGGLKGHHYVGIDDYIQETNAIRRVDADRHLDNFRKLLKGRVEVTLTPESTALYLIDREGLTADLFLSPNPHSRYDRRLFVTDDRQDIRDDIEKAFSGAAAKEAWRAVLDRYR